MICLLVTFIAIGTSIAHCAALALQHLTKEYLMQENICTIYTIIYTTILYTCTHLVCYWDYILSISSNLLNSLLHQCNIKEYQ